MQNSGDHDQMARVFISDSETVVLDGELLTVAAGQEVHVRVLDALHAMAMDRSVPVKAKIVRRLDLSVLHLEVAPDGSSRMLGPEHPLPARDLDGMPSEASDEEAGDLLGFYGPPSVPSSMRHQLARINELVLRQEWKRASVLATALREQIALEEGAQHPYAVEALAVEAYVAHLGGDHRSSTALALAVARIRCTQGDARAADEVTRATAAWSKLDGGSAAFVHGSELSGMWDQLEAQGRLSSAHRKVAAELRRRVTLTAP